MGRPWPSGGLSRQKQLPNIFWGSYLTGQPTCLNNKYCFSFACKNYALNARFSDNDSLITLGEGKPRDRSVRPSWIQKSSINYVSTSIYTDYNGLSVTITRQHITHQPTALAYFAWQDMIHAAWQYRIYLFCWRSSMGIFNWQYAQWQRSMDFNILKTKHNLLYVYIRNQFVPRCKLFPPRLQKPIS